MGSTRVLVEQLRVVHLNARVSFLSTGVLSLLMVAALSREGAAGPFVAWSVLVWLSVGTSLWLAHRFLHAPRPADIVHAHLRQAVAFYGWYGLLWGSLCWLALPSPDPLGIALVVGIAAGTIAGGMSFLAPALPVFIAYGTLHALLLAARLLTLDAPASVALGLATLLYVATLVGQARQASRTMREMIELRFANADLVERLRAETDRALAARAEAEEANLAKSKFLAAASHDLRQPVHATGLLLDVLGRSALDERQRRIHGNLVSSTGAAREMLTTLLDFSRIEAGVVHAQPRRFRLQPLLAKVENELAIEADTKDLVYRTRDTALAVESDPALVELVLRNFVSNAIRYTARGGVLVAARRRGDTAVLEVWDTGIGIPRDQHAAVFREFHQLGNPERDRAKGLGLGLAIAEGIARTLGHSLTLASRPGRGSVFRLALPLAEAPTGEPAPQAQPQRFDVNVLVIDDDAAAREALLVLVESWGARCVAVESIDEALASARRTPPGLVITDYRLREERTGGEAVAALRAQVGASLPAIIVTGDTAPERLREAAATGATLLHKPVAPQALRAAVAALLEG